jgi:hypothetical protein
MQLINTKFSSADIIKNTNTFPKLQMCANEKLKCVQKCMPYTAPPQKWLNDMACHAED